MSRRPGAHPLIPRYVRMFAVPIVLFWFGLVVVLSVAVPPLEPLDQRALAQRPLQRMQLRSDLRDLGFSEGRARLDGGRALLDRA